MYKRSKPLHYHVVCSHKLFLLFNYSIKIANRVRNFVFSDKSSTQSIFYNTTTGFSHGFKHRDSFKPSPWIKFGHVIKKLENNNILRNVPLFPNQFLLLIMVKVDCSPLSLSKVLFIERFSSLKKLVTTFAYVRRFIHNVRMKVLKKDELLEGDISTAEEFEQSLNTLVRFEQFYLQAQSNYEKVKSSLKLFTDAAGFIRLKGRFCESTMTFQEQCPILLRSRADSHNNNNNKYKCLTRCGTSEKYIFCCQRATCFI